MDNQAIEKTTVSLILPGINTKIERTSLLLPSLKFFKIGEGVSIGHYNILEGPVEIKNNCFIAHHVHIRPETFIGERTEIRTGAFIEGQCKIGANCRIMQHAHIAALMTIEDDVYIGPYAVLSNSKRAIVPAHRGWLKNELSPPRINKGARIGSGAQILSGVTVGENAFVGAGAIVTKDVSDATMVVGNPARNIGAVPFEELIV